MNGLDKWTGMLSKVRSGTPILLCALFCSICPAANLSPLSVVEAFFAPDGIDNKEALYTGEMLSFLNEPTLGQQLGRGVSKDVRLLSSFGSTAMYCIALKHQGITRDWYAFLRKVDGTWRLEAVRTLAQTGLLEFLITHLRKKRDRTPEENWKLRNAELTLSSDADLKRYLRAHQSEFEVLVSVVRNGTAEAVASAAKALFLGSARITPAGHIELIVGGVLDDKAGYFYFPDGVTLPSLAPNDVIYLEKIIDRWYVFKTT